MEYNVTQYFRCPPDEANLLSALHAALAAAQIQIVYATTVTPRGDFSVEVKVVTG